MRNSKKLQKVLPIFLVLVLIVVGLFLGWESLSGIKYSERPLAYGSFVEGVVGQPQTLNPLFSTSDVDRDLARLIFSSLVSREPDGSYQGDLAEEFAVSKDGKSIEFKLRKGVKWHNGAPLTAEDVIFSYNIVKRSDYTGPYARLLQDISAENKNGKIVLSSKKPDAALLSWAELPIIPKQNISSDPKPLSAKLDASPPGSGPFKFNRSIISENGKFLSVELVSNSAYFKKEPYLRKIFFRFFDSQSQLWEAAQRGEITGMLDQSLKANKLGFSIHSCRQPAYIAAFLNLGNPYLMKKEVRQALDYALDRKKMNLQFANEFGQAIAGPIFAKDYQKLPDPNISLAKKKMLDLMLGKIVLKLVTVNEKRFLKLAEYLKESWRELGVSLEIRAETKEKLEQVEIPEHNFDILLFGQSFGFGADAFSFWHSTQIASGGNASSWQNKDADFLLEKARATFDKGEKTKILQKVAALIMQDKPALFLFQPEFVYGLKSEVKGAKIADMQMPSDRFAEVEKWYVKTKKYRLE